MKKSYLVTMSLLVIGLASVSKLGLNSLHLNNAKEISQSTKITTTQQGTTASTSQSTNFETTYKKFTIYDDFSSELSIISVGDILFHMPQVNSAKEKDSYNFKPMFSQIKSLVESKDIAVANFETTVNPKKKPSGYPCFNTPVQALEAIKSTGFDILLNDHNHSLDTGVEGLKSTNKYIKEYGFKVLGSGEPQEDKWLIVEKNGIKVGMLSYTYGTNVGIQYKDLINYIDEKKINKDIATIKSKCDFIIVYLHLGTEYVRSVENFQENLVNNVAQMGADAILCSHPHVARKTEMLNVSGRNVLVNYSMGNFISNQNDKYTDIGSMQSITIEKKGSVTRIKSTETIPVYRLRYSNNGKMVYQTVPVGSINNYSNIIDAKTISYINDASSKISYKYNAPYLPPIQRRVFVEVDK